MKKVIYFKARGARGDSTALLITQKHKTNSRNDTRYDISGHVFAPENATIIYSIRNDTLKTKSWEVKNNDNK